VKVPHRVRGSDSRPGPEQCVDVQRWRGEALAGEHTGAVWGSEITVRKYMILALDMGQMRGRYPFFTDFRSNLFAAEFIGIDDKDGVDGEEMLKYQERESRKYGNKGESVANIVFGDI